MSVASSARRLNRRLRLPRTSLRGRFDWVDPEMDPAFLELVRQLDEAMDSGDSDRLWPLVVAVWSGLRYPEGRYRAERWVKAFELVNESGAILPPSGDPLVLYRGTIPDLKLGMAWSTDRQIACEYAEQWIKFFDPSTGYLKPTMACVYKTTAQLSAVLYVAACNPFAAGRPGEREVVVNPQLLDEITLVKTVAA
jgi:hypothetical protein